MNAKFWWIYFFRLSFILGLLGDWREHFFFSHFQVYTIIAFIHTETEAENYLIKGEFNQFGCQNSWPWSNALYVQFVGVFFSSHLDRDIQQIIDMQTIWVLFYFNEVGFLWGFFCQKSKWNLGNTMLSSNENFWTNVLFYLFNWSSRWTLKIQHQNGILNRMPFEWVGFIMNGYGIRQPSHFVCGWRNKIVRLAYLGVEFSFSIHVLCFTGPNTLGFNSFSKWARHYQEMFCFNLCVIEVNEERFLKWKRQQNDTIKKKINWMNCDATTDGKIYKIYYAKSAVALLHACSALWISAITMKSKCFRYCTILFRCNVANRLEITRCYQWILWIYFNKTYVFSQRIRKAHFYTKCQNGERSIVRAGNTTTRLSFHFPPHSIWSKCLATMIRQIQWQLRQHSESLFKVSFCPNIAEPIEHVALSAPCSSAISLVIIIKYE